MKLSDIWKICVLPLLVRCPVAVSQTMIGFTMDSSRFIEIEESSPAEERELCVQAQSMDPGEGEVIVSVIYVQRTAHGKNGAS